MTTRPPLERILEGIFPAEEKDTHFPKTVEKDNHARVWNEEQEKQSFKVNRN